MKKINQTEFKKFEALKERYGFAMYRDGLMMPCCNKACPYINETMRCSAPVHVAIDEEGRCPVWRDLSKEEEQEIPTPNAEMVRMLLELIDVENVPLAVIEGWTAGQRLEVVDYASCVQLRAGDHDDIEVPPIPDVLKQYGRNRQ